MYTNPPTKMAILINFHQIRKDQVGPEEYMPTDEIAVPITVAIIISMIMMIMKYDNDDDDDDDDDNHQVTLIFMGLYIFGGAALFHAWEGDLHIYDDQIKSMII